MFIRDIDGSGIPFISVHGVDGRVLGAIDCMTIEDSPKLGIAMYSDWVFYPIDNRQPTDEEQRLIDEYINRLDESYALQRAVYWL